jgi:hypothetical protein
MFVAMAFHTYTTEPNIDFKHISFFLGIALVLAYVSIFIGE